jgi:hypothetical protein
MDDQVRYYESKLQYEIDPWDLNEALERGDKIFLSIRERRRPTGEATSLTPSISHIEG